MPAPLAENHIVQTALERAREQGLARSRGWLELGHYRRGRTGGAPVSQADGARFFLHPRGKYDPALELETTLRAILAPPPGELDRQSADAHAVCRFPARTLWLLKNLEIDPRMLPVRYCPGFMELARKLAARKVTLVFSSYYLNNPASAFGHSFLRLQRARPGTPDGRAALLDYGVDFAAQVDTSNSLIYAIKGISGLFEGHFSRIPYFYKVREYNDVESRDLWEYDLALTPAQIQLLVAHIWELGHTHFDYFYASENCSYHVLGLLQAVLPELDLVNGLRSPVIPSETVKRLAAQPGLISARRYRPSLRSQLNARTGDLSRSDLQLVRALEEDPTTPISPDIPKPRAAVLMDTAAELLDVESGRAIISSPGGPEALRKRNLLARRAALRVITEAPEVPVANSDPTRGHGARRIGLGLLHDGGRPMLTLDARVALHDLADPVQGFPDLMGIEFLPMRLRFGARQPQTRPELDFISLLRVTSLSDFAPFNRQFSWRVELGLERLQEEVCQGCLAGHGRLGTGLTRAFWRDRFALFLLSESQVYLGSRVPGLLDTGLRLGAGLWGGARLRLHPDLVALTTGSAQYFPLQDAPLQYEVRSTLRWQWIEGAAWDLQTRQTAALREGSLSALLYF